MRLLTIWILSIFTSLSALNAQSAVDLNALDSIVVKVNDQSEAYYLHQIKKGETVYSLASFFRVDFKDILIRNGFQQNSIIPLGTILKIPLNKKHLLTSASRANIKSIPVYYHVKKRETLFKISQVYFDQKIEDLILRNSINKLSLKIDQQLLVGWWPLQIQEENTDNFTVHNPVASADTATYTEIIVSEKHLSLDVDRGPIVDSIVGHSTMPFDTTSNIPTAEEISIQSQNGIAIWEKNDPNTETMLVLHRSAKIGSVIKLQNPVTERIAVAQVVGNIPANVYTDDVDIIISKAVAVKLGALDTRFQIHMTFYE